MKLQLVAACALCLICSVARADEPVEVPGTPDTTGAIEPPEEVTVKIDEKGSAEVLNFSPIRALPVVYSLSKPTDCTGFWSKDWKTFTDCRGGFSYVVRGPALDPGMAVAAQAFMSPKPGEPGTEDPGPDQKPQTPEVTP